MFLCENCGSLNHLTSDCSKPEDPAAVAAAKAKAAPAAPKRPAAEPEAAEAATESGTLPPRWKGGPPVCAAANLPMFDDEKQFAAFEAVNCPGGKVLLKFVCRSCSKLHVWVGGFDPAGQSSGNTRTSLHYDEAVGEAAYRFRALLPPELAAKAKKPKRTSFLRDCTVAGIERRKREVPDRSPELPVQKEERAPLALPKAEKKLKQPSFKQEGGLF